MAENTGAGPRLGDYHAEPAGPSVGTLVEGLLVRVHALELEVQQLNVRVAELEAAAMPRNGK